MSLASNYYKRQGHFCSKGRNSRICHGDKGGPLFCTSNNKELVSSYNSLSKMARTVWDKILSNWQHKLQESLLNYPFFQRWLAFDQFKNLSFGAELQKPTLFGLTSHGGDCGINYPNVFSDVRIPEVSDWIKNVTNITTTKTICEKLEIYFGGNPFGVNGFYNLKNNGNREEWVRDGFRIHSDGPKRYWFITPDGHRGKFLEAPRTSDCPSGYWHKT